MFNDTLQQNSFQWMQWEVGSRSKCFALIHLLRWPTHTLRQVELSERCTLLQRTIVTRFDKSLFSVYFCNSWYLITPMCDVGLVLLSCVFYHHTIVYSYDYGFSLHYSFIPLHVRVCVYNVDGGFEMHICLHSLCVCACVCVPACLCVFILGGVQSNRYSCFVNCLLFCVKFTLVWKFVTK